ncbi:MAG: hypothetical protein D5R97_02745 [Candidatus Syntrophonatronum acetioxidans]|uniref:Lipid/polyisoprenoid-binding YceI-like domain-containing protein n=1 Tax=Candidatus Syntrophonatronum acetioxidans TaxID=1795816 RepID=A0A424YGU7_9FIRM|nr:MAG: hypothetical protein D5R97_02745 [Candidatus Syntrophonatronum acetioxidans]
MLKKTFLLFLALMMMGTVMYGCGSPANDVEEEAINDVEVMEEEETIDEEAAEEALIEVENWEAPGSLQELLATFKEIRHTWSEGGEEVASVHYLHEGSDTVDGVQTDKVSFSISDEKFTLWIDGEGNTQQIEAGGEALPKEMGDMMFTPFISSILMPFKVSQDWNVNQKLAQPEPGIYIKSIEKSQETIGELTGTIHTFEVTLEPPHVPEGERGMVRWKVADFGDFQMLVGWEALESAGEKLNIEFKIDRLALQ